MSVTRVSAPVAVVILSLNQKEKTVRCLESVGRFEPAAGFRTVLWDNGSTDGTVELVRRRFPEVLVHHSPTNLGVASGRNAAARLAIEAMTPRYLMFLDNDTVVTPDALNALVAPFESDERLAQTAPKIRLYHDPVRLDEAGGSHIDFWLGRVRVVGHGQADEGQFDTPRPCLAGGCTLVRTDVFEALGGFDPTFNPYGPEDMDFSLRLRAQGYRSLYVPQAVIYHERTQTFESGRYTQRFAAQKARNWLILMWRHASVVELAGFIFIGGPWRLLQAGVREGRRGNFAALWGLIGGSLRTLGSPPHSRP